MIKFQWDDNKERINISKHGLSFRAAANEERWYYDGIG